MHSTLKADRKPPSDPKTTIYTKIPLGIQLSRAFWRPVTRGRPTRIPSEIVICRSLFSFLLKIPIASSIRKMNAVHLCLIAHHIKVDSTYRLYYCPDLVIFYKNISFSRMSRPKMFLYIPVSRLIVKKTSHQMSPLFPRFRRLLADLVISVTPPE